MGIFPLVASQAKKHAYVGVVDFQNALDFQNILLLRLTIFLWLGGLA